MYEDRDSDGPDRAYRPDKETMDLFGRDPWAVFDACFWWQLEAESRALDGVQEIPAAWFYGTTQALMVYGDRKQMALSRIWDFYCRSTDCIRENNLEDVTETKNLISWLNSAMGEILRLKWGAKVEAEDRGIASEAEPRADGPGEKQGEFWWGGDRYPLSKNRWLMLRCLYGKDSVSFAEFAENVWGDELTAPGKIRTEVSRLNANLKKNEIPLKYDCENSYVIANY